MRTEVVEGKKGKKTVDGGRRKKMRSWVCKEVWGQEQEEKVEGNMKEVDEREPGGRDPGDTDHVPRAGGQASVHAARTRHRSLCILAEGENDRMPPFSQFSSLPLPLPSPVFAPLSTSSILSHTAMQLTRPTYFHEGAAEAILRKEEPRKIVRPPSDTIRTWQRYMQMSSCAYGTFYQVNPPPPSPALNILLSFSCSSSLAPSPAPFPALPPPYLAADCLRGS
eukprot:754299-Hanusia_phi.AAC.1